ncbi:unnamed protein product [Thelazia callipaeda]|uniref:Nexin_C domain-containing protein n=1 Tax=Thelazia callipaeda TaxID=103827 RepID=A0A0N5CJ34_THECL|nr:unnamed protein product [Thelazia callipaeda]
MSMKYVNRITSSDQLLQLLVGIPQWVVDIRHGATHSHLPSLKSLRQAAKYCRDWLWEHHWSRPVAEAIGLNFTGQEESDENELQQKAATLIDRFMIYSLETNENKPEMKKKLQDVLTQMETFIMMYPWQFLNAFLLEGYLILDKVQISSVGYDLFSSEIIWDIPENLQLFWKPVFHYINEAKMLHELLMQMFEALLDSDIHIIRKRQLIAWIDRLLNAYVECKPSVLNEAEWKRILKAMMMAPKELKEAHLNDVLDKVEKVCKKKKAALRKLSVLLSDSADKQTVETSPSSLSGNSLPIRTVDDLRQLMLQSESKKQPQVRKSTDASDSKHRWTSCNLMEWKGIPLGLTPEQSTESLYLVIEPQ